MKHIFIFLLCLPISLFSEKANGQLPITPQNQNEKGVSVNISRSQFQNNLLTIDLSFGEQTEHNLFFSSAYVSVQQKSSKKLGFWPIISSSSSKKSITFHIEEELAMNCFISLSYYAKESTNKSKFKTIDYPEGIDLVVSCEKFLPTE